MSSRPIRVLLTTSCFATFAMAALAVEPIAADKRARYPEQRPAFTDGRQRLRWRRKPRRRSVPVALSRMAQRPVEGRLFGGDEAPSSDECVRCSKGARAASQIAASVGGLLQENCALEGGLEGGSNLWVTHFASLCEERELKARIAFLHGIQP